MITQEQVARIAHEVNRAYCQSIDDNSQPAWEDAPGWQRESTINGISFYITNPDASPSTLHAAWLETKIKAGWVYGPVKNADLREHPCCRPYDQLPKEQQTKDYLFRAVVHACLM